MSERVPTGTDTMRLPIRSVPLEEIRQKSRHAVAQAFLLGTGVPSVEVVDLAEDALVGDIDPGDYIRASGLTEQGQDRKWEFSPLHAYALVQSRAYKPEKNKPAKFNGMNLCVYPTSRDGSVGGRPQTQDIEKSGRKHAVRRSRPDGTTYEEFTDKVVVRPTRDIPFAWEVRAGHISFLSMGERAVHELHDEIAFADRSAIEDDALIAIPCADFQYLRMRMHEYRQGVAAVVRDPQLQRVARSFLY